MNILLLGATGKVGRFVLAQALSTGHHVTALVRSPAKITIRDPHLRVIQGDVRDPAQIAAAMIGTNAVLSALGHNSAKTSDVQTAATRAILAAITPSQRFITLTGFGVPDPHDPKPTLTGRLMNEVIKRIPGKMYHDSARHAELLRVSKAHWVLVRAPRMAGNQITHTYRTGYFPISAFTAVSRGDVADFMLANLTSDTWLGQAPLIASK